MNTVIRHPSKALCALAVAAMVAGNMAHATERLDAPGPGYREQAGQLKTTELHRLGTLRLFPSPAGAQRWDRLRSDLRQFIDTLPLPELPTENIFARPFRLFEAPLPATPGGSTIVPEK